jgi:hypothetical protein
MEPTAEQAPVEDWLAGATVEFGGEFAEPVHVALEGVDFGSDEEPVA